jgi:hypothetical protein
MKFTRRDLFVWGAGAAAGLAFTPVPWKLLDDTSIWSQNWPWIPQPVRGPVDVKQSFCTLCPKGCAVKVRMAGGWPVGVAGVASNPLMHGALCPLGFGAHQLNWHPERLRGVLHKGDAASWSDAQTAFAKACSEGPVIVIDGYPGRAASSVMQGFAAKRGNYQVASSPEFRALRPYEQWTGVPARELGYDLENAQTILSFGAPLLDGWGMPGRFSRLWAERAAGVSDPKLRLIQVENSLSRTAARAWRWINLPSGAEGPLASGLGQVLIEEHLVVTRGPVPPLTLAEAANQTGMSENEIRELAHTVMAKPPVVVIATDENAEVAALNVLLGAVGARGGIVRRPKRSEPTVGPGEISKARAVVIDASVPWDFSPQVDAEVFRFAAWNGGSSKADWLIPASGFGEELTDIPTEATSAIQTYAVATPLVKAASDVHSTAELLACVDPTLGTTEKIIQSRCEELFRARKGTVYGSETVSVAKLDSAQTLEEQLQKGAIWIGDPPSPGGLRCVLKEWPQSIAAGRASDWARAWTIPVLPPLATKLYQESNLRDAPDRRNA